ncbi:MAG: sulfotransferase [Nitrospirae bacterium]|nr:sulfotransferase [Nitrospirota bacterium]
MKKTVQPNFIVIGSMKSGTTTLCHLIGQHPDVFMSEPKEVEFFCKDEIYEKGWDWYMSLFDGAKNKPAIGEGSTSYTKAPLFPKVPERIARHLPDIRLIYIVRHPLERIESHWMHRVRHGDVRTFRKMLREYPNLIDTSRYWSQIQLYRKYFRDDQILVLFFEDLKKKPEMVLKQCFAFLNVNPGVRLANPAERRNVAPKTRAESDLLKRMKENPLLDAAGRIIPSSLKKYIKEKLEIRIDSRPVWEEAKRKLVISDISGEARTFLSFYGKPADFWDLSIK